MPIYRNQSNTMTQITNLSHLRITTTQEAVAYLRAVQPLNEQVAAVLQRAALQNQHSLNQVVKPVAPQPEPAPTPEPEKKFVPEDLSSDDGYSDAEVEAMVARLRKTKETKAKKKEK